MTTIHERLAEAVAAARQSGGERDLWWIGVLLAIGSYRLFWPELTDVERRRLLSLAVQMIQDAAELEPRKPPVMKGDVLV